MLPEPATPGDWLRHAASDLAVARQGRQLEGVLLDTLCFHAQQAAAKSLKSVLLHHGVAFPYTHDIARLITLVTAAGIPWPDALDQAAELTYFAVQSRYPNPTADLDEEAWREAVDIAERTVDWARDLLAG